MKTRMKKYVAMLLGILMILQVLPGFAVEATITVYSEIVEGSDEGYRPELTIAGQEDGMFLLAGQTLSLTLPEEYTDVTWSSSNDAIATVSEKGVVTGVGQGTVTIRVQDNLDRSVSASVTLDVINPDVTYTVTYEVRYPSDAAEVIVSSTQKKKMKDITYTEKTSPVVGNKAVRHVLWSGDFDADNYTMVGWKTSGSDDLYTQGQKVKISKNTTFTAVFEKKEVTRKQQSLTVYYYNKKADGSEYYSGKGEWAGRGSTAYLETVDGTVYATFPLTDSKDGASKTSEESGNGLNYSVNPWYFAENVMGLGKVTEITDEIIAAYLEAYKSVIGFRLSQVKGISADELTAWIREKYDSSVESYTDYVFELGEVVTLPYGNKTNGYYFEPVQSEGKSAKAEVRVRVDNTGYYIGQGELTQLGMETILKQPWPAKNNGPYGGGSQDEQNLFGEKVNGKYEFTSPVDPDGIYIAKAASVSKVLKKVGMANENEDNWEVIWFKLGQTRRGFLIEGILVPKTGRKQITIIVNGDKQKLTYDGQEHAISYTFESDDKSFKASKVKLVGDDTVRKDCGITLGSLTASNFKYEDKNVDPIFVVNNGSIWITPTKLTIIADDQERDAHDPDPEFTVSFDGLMDGDTGEDLKYRVISENEGSNAPGQYEIMIMGDKNQGNYKITFKSGTLTITGEETPRSVRIKSSLEGLTEVISGSEVTLTAIPEGFDGVEYTVQWYCETPEGEILEISGATELVYKYTINAENFRYIYRVVLTEIQ